MAELIVKPIQTAALVASGYAAPSGTKEITENGQYDVFDYAEVDVQVPQTIPIAPDSLTPAEMGIDADGVYISDTEGQGTYVAFGRDNNGIFGEGQV